MPVTRASIGRCIRCFPRFARVFPHVTCRRIRAGCTIFNGRALVIGREKGASWSWPSGRLSPHCRLGLHRMLRFRLRLSAGALHLPRVLSLVEGDEMPLPVHGNRPTEIVMLEGAIVAKRILAEQASILAKDEDPFVVDPRDHPRSLDRRVPDDRHAISRDGPLLHNALFHDAPAPPKVCGCRYDRNAGSLEGFCRSRPVITSDTETEAPLQSR